MSKIPELTEKNKTRFWSKVDKTHGHGPDGECWVWTTGKDKDGYGQFTIRRLARRAHRVSYFMEYGPIPEGKLILHKCDNPACVRPAHLWLGTTADNVKDRVRKGRNATGDRSGARLHPERIPRGDDHHARKNPEHMAHGEDHPCAKLTDRDSINIRSEYKDGGISQRGLARKYKIGQSVISGILLGKIWKHTLETEKK